MTDLEHFPSLQAFGEQIDARATRDARRGGWHRVRPGRVQGHAVAALAVLVALIAAASYAVPVTRAAVGDVYDRLAGWVSGDEAAAPGTPVRAGDDVPTWVAAEDGEKRVLAEADGERLYVIRDGRKLTLALNAFGESGTIDDFRASLAGGRIRIVGPGHFVANGRHDRRALFGLVSSTVTRIAYTYAAGGRAVTAAGLHGAFGIVIDADRRPGALLGYDAAGRVVARLAFKANHMDFRYCPGKTGCMPWRG